MTFDTRRPLLISLAALSVGGSLLLTGCQAGGATSKATSTQPAPSSGSSQPPASSSAESSAEPSVEPSVVPSPTAAPTRATTANPAANLPVPVLSNVAGDESKAGLEAFTQHWLDLLSYSYEANDLGPLEEVSDPECTFCASARTSMEQIYQMAWASGGTTTLTGFSTNFTPDRNGVYTADVTTSQNEIFYYSVEGWLGSSESKPDTPHVVSARYTDGQWELIDYTTPEAPDTPG